MLIYKVYKYLFITQSAKKELALIPVTNTKNSEHSMKKDWYF